MLIYEYFLPTNIVLLLRNGVTRNEEAVCNKALIHIIVAVCVKTLLKVCVYISQFC